MHLVFQPPHCSGLIPAAVNQDDGRNARLEDVEKQEGVFFVNRTGHLLPLAFDNQVIGEKLTIHDEEITLPGSLVNGLTYDKLFDELLPTNRPPILESQSLVIPELGVSLPPQTIIHKVFE